MPDTSAVYKPRKPQDSQYYHCVEDNFEEFERIYDDRFPKKYGFLRPYVKQVIYRYLDCGILHNGFARVKCRECGHEYLLAFSCKRRHFCPSCHQRSGPLDVPEMLRKDESNQRDRGRGRDQEDPKTPGTLGSESLPAVCLEGQTTTQSKFATNGSTISYRHYGFSTSGV